MTFSITSLGLSFLTEGKEGKQGRADSNSSNSAHSQSPWASPLPPQVSIFPPTSWGEGKLPKPVLLKMWSSPTPAATASLGNLSEMPMCGPYPDLLGYSPDICVLTNFPGNSNANLRTTGLNDLTGLFQIGDPQILFTPTLSCSLSSLPTSFS